MSGGFGRRRSQRVNPKNIFYMHVWFITQKLHGQVCFMRLNISTKFHCKPATKFKVGGGGTFEIQTFGLFMRYQKIATLGGSHFQI